MTIYLLKLTSVHFLNVENKAVTQTLRSFWVFMARKLIATMAILQNQTNIVLYFTGANSHGKTHMNAGMITLWKLLSANSIPEEFVMAISISQ